MKIFALPLLALALSLSACATTNPVHEPTKATAMTHATLISSYDFDTTVHRLKSTIESKGMTVFAVIDHAKSAQEVGMDMQPATVLIYGNPKAGTPLMQKDPAFALSLPLKVLVTEINGQVQVIYTPANELIKGSQIQPSDVANTLASAEKLIQATVK
ncbi:Uncharacterized conserved protein [Moraxella lacunata]|uniref:Uncharacterized conserved protein n=1 Tax=Moraxella lacunata TaxID=477 RepID=A0A378T9X4_MORLA|nr:DUF302 domain-containing protein [Moraxella lacunata]STZ56336.1 Uncharacterized conserved protein [Moraxella lacunata]